MPQTPSTKEKPTFPILGKRIAIIGATGSGKTTLAQQLGDVLDLQVLRFTHPKQTDRWLNSLRKQPV
jgi:adenylate kinase family enzyme